jgi:hypothetical protein
MCPDRRLTPRLSPRKPRFGSLDLRSSLRRPTSLCPYYSSSRALLGGYVVYLRKKKAFQAQMSFSTVQLESARKQESDARQKLDELERTIAELNASKGTSTELTSGTAKVAAALNEVRTANTAHDSRWRCAPTHREAGEFPRYAAFAFSRGIFLISSPSSRSACHVS